jgi:hypothetical protein
MSVRAPARPQGRARLADQVAPSKQTRLRGKLGLGGAIALLIHLQVLGPLLVATFIFAAREEAQRPDEVDVAFESVPPELLPQDLPAFDDTPPPHPLAEKEKKEKEKRRPDQKLAEMEKEAKKEEQQKPPPEPEVVVPPLPPVPQPKPPEHRPHEKMVDLDDGKKEVEPPPDAKFLAQKNNRAEKETRATDTNLEKQQAGEEGSRAEGERRDDPDVGDDKAKIAELEDLKSREGRQAPDVTPHQNPSVPSPEEPSTRPPVLSMRSSEVHRHELTPETADPSLPRDPAGALAQSGPKLKFHDHETARLSRDQRMKLALTGKDYEYLFGAEAKADRQLAQKERSTRLGRHAARLARVKSALENFIPEVQPGNQTALNTRAAPFAAFIARMHRSIHKLWGFGVLEDWDELPSSNPFNDESLMTKLEIVLNGDGTVNKVAMVQTSRYLAYDVAAIDAVLGAAPYPDPPREIRSGNGKIYIHWSFFRDGRQCATSGVEPKILDNAPPPGDVADDTPAAEPTRAGGQPAEEAPPAAGGGERPRRLRRDLDDRPARALGPPPASGSSPGPAPSARSGPATSPRMAPPAAGGGSPRSEDAGAAEVVKAWFAAYVRGDVEAMVARSSFPFRSVVGIAAANPADLRRMLKGLIAESPSRSAASVSVETGAGLRRLLGKLPPGLDDGSGLLFGICRTDGDTLILVLGSTPSGWKVVGLVRR